MNDPDVHRLKYRLKVDPNQLVFENPSPLFQEYDTFRILLEDGILTVEMKEHHATIESAREKIETFIRDWKIYVTFDLDRDLLNLEYENAEVIDRKPLPKVPGQITGHGSFPLRMQTLKGTGTVHPRKLSKYPAPPQRFRATPDVETMWFRYQQHLEDKETYQSMGYFCLSLMQWSTGEHKKARQATSRKYNIDRDILNELGRLTSERGTQRDARKLDSGSTFLPLTNVEKRWIRDTVKMLIRRKGEYDFDPATANALKQITMADLPNL